MIGHDDIQAAENRRREVAVKAGASPRATKMEPSVYKDMIVELVEDTEASVAERFRDLQAEVALPGYNFGADLEDAAKLTESAEGSAPLTVEEDIAEMERLQTESAENELQVTRTATGQPKVDESGNVVPPVQSETPEAAKPNFSSVPTKPGNVSPAASGDIGNATAVADKK